MVRQERSRIEQAERILFSHSHRADLFVVKFWLYCTELQSGQFCACTILKSHETWLKPITLKGKIFKNKKSLLTVNTKQDISPQLVDCQRRTSS